MSRRLGRKGLQDIASVAAGAIYRPLLSFSQCFDTSNISNHVLGNLGWWKVRLITVSVNEASQVSGGAANFVWSFYGFEIWNILEILVIGDREGSFCCACVHIGQADVAVAAQSKLQLSIVLTFRSCTRSSISSAEKLLQSKRQGADAQLCTRSIFMHCNDVAMLRKFYTVAIYCTVRIEGVWSFSISSHMWDIMVMRADIGVFR